ncbi:MAG: hypothetical protein ABIN00_01525 [candidate division WOR-3 bacterium]
MLMKIDRIDFDFYEKSSENFFGFNVFVSRKYLETFGGIKNIKIYSVSSENGIEAFFPVNERRFFFSKVFLTPQFTQFFNIILKNDPEHEKKKFFRFREIVSTYSIFLNKNFVYFSLPLHYDFYDVRIFQWNGINVIPCYSYIVEEFKENDASSFDELKLVTDSQKLYQDYLASYKGKTPIDKKDFTYVIDSLKEKELLKIFANSKASVAVLFDDRNKVAYLYVITGKDTIKLLNQIYKGGYFKGYKIDLVGANTERIAKYKSKIDPSLKLYFKLEKKYVNF